MGATLTVGRQGRMALGHKAEINVTPFVDVMLVLVIVFMVAAPLPVVWLKADMPPPGQTTPNQAQPVIVSIARGGRLTLNGHAVGLDALPSSVSEALGPQRRGGRILVRSNRDVAYKDFMAVMNQLESHGLTHVALISEDL
jgi:biopolymer transport protein ExbD